MLIAKDGRVANAVRGLCAVAALMWADLATAAYPERPITIIVPFTPGGATDILARIVGAQLGSRLHQSVIIDNRPGAGGNIGTAAVAKAPADGYTLVMGTVGTHAINQSIFKSTGYDTVKDFAPISRVAMVPNVLVVSSNTPFKTVKQLIDDAKAHPGDLTFASAGIGTSIQLSGELFKSMAGIDIRHIPFRGSAPALTALLGQQVTMMFDNLPSSFQQIKGGRLRALAVTSAKRSPALPDTPTIAEAGIKGYEATSWFGLLAPAGTPAEVVKTLNANVVAILAMPEVMAQLTEQGAEPHGETPDEFAAFIRSESAKWAKTVRDSGATAE
jgi:tripartite-type tricarboxylate transporter receptor subunit TctC